MEMKRSLGIALGVSLSVLVLGGLVLYLRLRNAPEVELVPIAGSVQGSGRTKPTGATNAPVKTGSKDNGYTPVPYDQLPRGKSPKELALPVPSAAPITEPVASPDGLSLPK